MTFERLTQLYLQAKPENQTALEKVWHCNANLPRAVRQDLNLTTTDEGIDLVAKTRERDCLAIQSKFRTDTEKPLTYGKLSTFANLAFNKCADAFAQAVVVHTSTRPVRKRKLLGNTTEIGLQRWLAQKCSFVYLEPGEPLNRRLFNDVHR